MVGDSGATLVTRRIRRLKLPQALMVTTDTNGIPMSINLGNGWQYVVLARRPWRIDQHWWRGESIHRDYYQVVPADGPPVTIYHDLVSDSWARQEYR